MKRALLSMLTALCLLLTLLPRSASADGGGYALAVSCNLSGADVYIDGTLVGVTPLSGFDVTSGTHAVRVELPGYNVFSDTVSAGDTVSATLTPELYPESATVEYLTVDDSNLSFSDALDTVYADKTNKWYVIQFAAGFTSLYLGDPLCLNTRGRFTIDGGGTVEVASGEININVSDVRLVGLSFTRSGRDQKAIQLRAPDENNDKAYNFDNVYVLGCTFTNCFEVGVATCGKRGYAGAAYGGAGTTNISNLVFSGNTFNGTSLFSFAGAGDEDYNVIDGYKICGNTFTDCGVGMLAGDAHTWYVYDYTAPETAPAYCEHNILRNVLVSGNSFTMTSSGTREYEGIISVSCANLGNSNNLTENVEIRHNTSRITGGDNNRFSSVSITNAAVSDGYDGGKDYNSHITAGMERTDNNIVRSISVHDNDFQLGSGRELQIYNMLVDKGGQCGSGNVMSGVSVTNNIITAVNGVRICNYYGNSLSGKCEDNTLSNVTFSGNRLSRSAAGDYNVGVLAAGSYMSSHGTATTIYPDYGGTMSGINIKGNAVTGYSYGVMAAGAVADYGNGMTLSEVEISGNTIETVNWNEYPIVDFGVVVTGASLPTPGEGTTAQRGSVDCLVGGVKVSGNSITARTGVAVCGFLASENIALPWTGNRAQDVSVSGNTINQRAIAGNDRQRTAGVVTADVIEVWYKLGYGGADTTDMIGGNRASGVDVGENTISADFATPTALFGGALYSQAATLGADWSWLKHTAADQSASAFERAFDGEYAAKRTLNDLWVYDTFTVNGETHALLLGREGGTLSVDWSAHGDFICVAALYSESGRLLAVNATQVSADDAAETLLFAFGNALWADAARAEAFMLSSAFAPLCSPGEYTPIA